jgi:ketosteroid isomerase-like protein
MGEAENVGVVQAAYAAFGRGDIGGVLDALDEGIVWQPVHGAAAHVPFAGERHGKDAVAEFFRIVGETETFEQFEPREFVAQGDQVVAIGHYRARAHGGGTFDSDFVMVFTLRGGRVVRFREYLDSAALNAAFAAARSGAGA